MRYTNEIILSEGFDHRSSSGVVYLFIQSMSVSIGKYSQIVSIHSMLCNGSLGRRR